MLPLSGIRTQEVVRIIGGVGDSAVTITLVTVGRHFPPRTVLNLPDEPAKSAEDGVRFGRDGLEADVRPVASVACVRVDRTPDRRDWLDSRSVRP